MLITARGNNRYWLGLKLQKESAMLGPVKITVSQIEAGTQHNVIPDECRFVIDIRTTDAYSNEETARIVDQLLESEAKERSTRVHHPP